MIDDYLAVRPDRRDRVVQLLREGALVMGPWYTMPDEFLVSGEALVRNLLLGRHIADELRVPCSRAGLVCDMFGHISQLPQILAGFGAAGALLWRGVNTRKRTLLWRGADGTELPCHRFGPHGYGSYAFSVRGGFCYEEFVPPPERVSAYLDAELAATDSGPLLFFDSCDHQEWDAESYETVLRCARHWPDGLELVHSNLDRFLDEMAATFDPSIAVSGELREPGREPMCSDRRDVEGDEQWLIPGVASSRVHLKQANVECEAVLTRWAEPFSAAVHRLLGVDHAPGFLDLAWKLLLQNHAHDSIGGCSVDAVHRDMESRFDQARSIGEKVAGDALCKLTASIEGQVEDGEIRVTVFNPQPRPRTTVCDLALRIPDGWPQFEEFFGYERKAAFRIYDAESGDEVLYQRLGHRLGLNRARIRPTKLLEQDRHDVVEVAVELQLPATGYRTLIVRAPDAASPFTRHPSTPGLATSDQSAANEHLAVRIESDATLTLTDLHTGDVYSGLMCFEDSGDIGDGWFYCAPANDEILLSRACAAEVALLADGPLLTRFRVMVDMPVPARFDEATQRRSDARVPMRLQTTVTLRRGARAVELRTEVINPAADHRVRVLFPAGTSAKTYFADSPFDIVEREVALQSDNHLYRELETETRPMSSWAVVTDRGRGLAVVTAGLHEAAVRDLPYQQLRLTLFRCTGRTAFTNREPGGQLLGRRLVFDYRLMPIATIHGRELCEAGQELAAGIDCCQLTPADQAIHRTERHLTPVASLVEITGEAVLTSLRRVADALELRAFNPTHDEQKIEVVLGGLVGDGTARRVRMDGEPAGELELQGDRMTIRLAPKQIITVRLT